MVMWFKQMVNNRLVTRVILGATLDEPAKIIKNDTKEFRKEVMKRRTYSFGGMARPPQCRTRGPMMS